MTLRVLEAFSGVGSQRMALRNLGINHEVVVIAEIDKFAIQSYEALHGEVNNLGDISKVNPDDVPDHDLFTYSFPCQDISIAGKGKGFEKGSGTRSGLLWECEKVIRAKKPKYLLMENVKNLVSKKFMTGFEEWLKALEGMGYTNYWKVLNAKDYGIPQNRQRVFVVSILGEHEAYKFPEPIELKNKMTDLLESDVEERFYLTDKNIAMLTKEDTGKYPRKKRFLDNIEIGNEIARTIQTRQRMAPDENYVITNPSGKTLEEKQLRQVTPLECWRLMGFSDEDFYKAKKEVSNTQLYKQAGNSIVVNVLEGIFSQMFKEVKKEQN